MVTERIPSLIRKIQSLLTNESDISQLEKDLCKEYLRELYGLVEELPISEKYRNHFPASQAPIKKEDVTLDTKIFVEPDEIAAPLEEEVEVNKELVSAPIAPIVDSKIDAGSNGYTPEVESIDQKRTSEPTYIQKPSIKIAEEIDTHVADPIAEVIMARVPTPTNYEPLFENDRGNDLSDKLSRTPIADLTKAFSINEKLIIVSELFQGDQASFQDTIDILNGKYSFDEAKTHLLRYVIDKNEWLDEGRSAAARDFIRLVERRYL